MSVTGRLSAAFALTISAILLLSTRSWVPVGSGIKPSGSISAPYFGRKLVRLRGGAYNPDEIKQALNTQTTGNAYIDRLKNNPQLVDQFSKIMADPQLQGLMLKPGMMEKMQNFIRNPSAPVSDPDILKLQEIMQSKLAGIMGGGGMGGDFPSAPGAAPKSAPQASAPAAEEEYPEAK